MDIVSVCLASILISKVSSASASPSHHVLVCGNVRYELTNSYAPDATIRRQSMKGRRPNGSEFSIDLRNRDENLDDVMTASVEEWLCVKAPHHTFVELLYSCNVDMKDHDVDRYCRGNAMGEWMRYIGPDGQPLDAGFETDDPRYAELRRHLGIAGNHRIQLQEETMVPVD